MGEAAWVVHRDACFKWPKRDIFWPRDRRDKGADVDNLAGEISRARFECAFAAAVLIALVCFSRMYLSLHFLSDVTAGVLVGLFCYLNQFTRRNYFSVWTAAWLFYAFWLTLSLVIKDPGIGTWMFLFEQWSISISAVFL